MSMAYEVNIRFFKPLGHRTFIYHCAYYVPRAVLRRRVHVEIAAWLKGRRNGWLDRALGLRLMNLRMILDPMLLRESRLSTYGECYDPDAWLEVVGGDQYDGPGWITVNGVRTAAEGGVLAGDDAAGETSQDQAQEVRKIKPFRRKHRSRAKDADWESASLSKASNPTAQALDLIPGYKRQIPDDDDVQNDSEPQNKRQRARYGQGRKRVRSDIEDGQDNSTTQKRQRLYLHV